MQAKILGAPIILTLSTVLCVIICKIACWMQDVDRKTDKKLYGMGLEDYDNNKKCAVAKIITLFLIITAVIIYKSLRNCNLKNFGGPRWE